MNLKEKQAYTKGLAKKANDILNLIRSQSETINDLYLGSKWNEILRTIGTKNTKKPRFKIGTSKMNTKQVIAYGQQLHKFITEYEKHKESYTKIATKSGMTISNIADIVELMKSVGIDTSIQKIYDNVDRQGDIATIIMNKQSYGMDIAKENIEYLKNINKQNENEIDEIVNKFSNYGEWL